MKTKLIIMSINLIILSLLGCRWQDDFRARDISYDYLENPPAPTLNPESQDFVVNDTNKTQEDEFDTPLPDIDTKIPPIKEAPGV